MHFEQTDYNFLILEKISVMTFFYHWFWIKKKTPHTNKPTTVTVPS